jgi:hypothetical protein
MGKKTKVKRKRNVKKTRRKRIRGGMTDEERRAAEARMKFAQQLAQQRAVEKYHEEQAEAQRAAEQLAADQQRMGLAQRQKADANWLRQKNYIEDTARMEQDNKAPRGWVVEYPLDKYALDAMIEGSDKSRREKTHEVIKRNDALMTELALFFETSTKILDDITAKKSVSEKHKNDARALIKSIVSGIAAKIEIDFIGFTDANIEYLKNVGSISIGYTTDELLSEIIHEEYFDTVLSLYGIYDDTSYINHNMTGMLETLLYPKPYKPISEKDAKRNIKIHLAKIKELLEGPDDL